MNQKELDTKVKELFETTQDIKAIQSSLTELTSDTDYWTPLRIDKRIRFVSIQLGLHDNIKELVESYTLQTDKDIYNILDQTHISKYCLKLIEIGTNRIDIVNELARYTNRSGYSANKFYREALKAVELEMRADIGVIRSDRIRGLEADLRAAYDRFKEAETDSVANQWFKTYLDVKKLIDSYYPNNLQMKDLPQEDEEKSINISYKVVGQSE